MPSVPALLAKTNPLMTAALNVIFPPRCASCRTMVDSVHRLCNECFASLQLITDPCCARCGDPFPFALGEDAACAACLQSAPPFSAARAAMVYDAISRPLITRLKYGDQHGLVPPLSAQMLRAGMDVLRGADWLVPVPLHPKRLRQRKFNQSALLAAALSKRTGIPHLPDGLQRVLHTPPQASLPREERLKNVSRAFRVNIRRAEQLRGAKVVLIDDVVTTGATIRACTHTLLAAEAASVYILSAAKTLGDKS